MKLPSRRTKIVATLGPSSSDETTIENLIKAGVNVFRLNFSHGSKEDHTNRFNLIHNAAKKTGKPIAILQDLQGPKLRVGVFPNDGITLDKGEEVALILEQNINKVIEKKKKVIPYNYEKLIFEIKAGERILLDDGNMELIITSIKDEKIFAQVVFGGYLKNRKGMNFPDTNISIQSFTPKDKEDLLFGLKMGVDYVALSFVRSANDIRTIQKFIHSYKKKVPIVAKIEKKEAITNLTEILEVTDAVMVARGDLAVEVGTAQVPVLQKQIIHACRQRGIPVITATQMLESMVSTPRPTRAEASDVANAIFDGTDAVMLSAESASGKFPVLTVSVMHNIILEAELSPIGKFVLPAKESLNNSTIVQAIEHAAAHLATWVDAKAIACTTHTGEAARALAQYRPQVPIVAFTDSPEVFRQLALVWGVEAHPINHSQDIEKLFEIAEDVLAQKGYAQKGELVVFTAGWPPLKHGTTNLLKVVSVKKEYQKSDIKPHESKEPVLGYRTRRGQFVIDQNLCIQCGGCVEVCPNDIFGIQDRKVYLKESNCKNCTFDDACMDICPTDAVEVIRLED